MSPATFPNRNTDPVLDLAPAKAGTKIKRSVTAEWPAVHMMAMDYKCPVPFGPLRLSTAHQMGQLAETVELSHWIIHDDSACLRLLVTQNTAFTALDCTGCSGLTDQGLQVLSRRGSGLRVLNLRDCPALGTTGLAVVAIECATLTDLDLSGCTGLGDEGVVVVAQHCHGLVVLNVSGVPKATDAGLTAVSYGCPMLQTLRCRDCPQIGDTGVKSLLHRCKELAELDLSGCHTVRGRAFVSQPLPDNALVRHYPLKALRLTNVPMLHQNAVSW